MEYEDIAQRLSTFVFPRNRLNLIELNNIKFIDDTYNSNPLSLNQALEVLDNFKTAGRKIFVMGDMLELGSSAYTFHRQAIRKVAGVCDALITVGKLSNLAAQEASGILRSNIKDIFSCREIKQAKEILFNQISPGQEDIILVKGSRAMKMEEIFALPPALSSA
jgi:UDP-N-acetylmuramyl pentapeptide synthase